MLQLSRRLGQRPWIVSAPMANVSGARLADAVSAGGGLGMLGGAYCEPAKVEQLLTDSADVSRIGIGFITWALRKNPGVLDTALAARPSAIMLSFDHSLEPFASKIVAAGVPLIAQVQTVAMARAAYREGAQVIVAQGSEAGGHGASGRGTMALVPAVCDALELLRGTAAGCEPAVVLAAGGIGDGRGVAAAVALGAHGALMGTAFMTARESLASSAMRQTLVASSGDATERSNTYDRLIGADWPEEFTIRTMRSPVLDEANVTGVTPELSQTILAARAAGDHTIAPVIAGESVDMVRESGVPAAELVERFKRQARALVHCT